MSNPVCESENKFAVGSGAMSVCVCYYEEDNNWCSPCLALLFPSFCIPCQYQVKLCKAWPKILSNLNPAKLTKLWASFGCSLHLLDYTWLLYSLIIKPGFQMQVGEQAHQKEASFYSYQCCMASKQCNTLGLTAFQLSQSLICFYGLVDLNVFLGSVLSISTILCCDHTGTVGYNIYRLQMSGFLCLCERGGCTVSWILHQVHLVCMVSSTKWCVCLLKGRPSSRKMSRLDKLTPMFGKKVLSFLVCVLEVRFVFSSSLVFFSVLSFLLLVWVSVSFGIGSSLSPVCWYVDKSEISISILFRLFSIQFSLT